MSKNKILIGALLMAAFVLPAGFNACSVVDQTFESEGGTTVGTPMVEFKFGTYAATSPTHQLSVCVDRVLLALADGSAAQVMVPIEIRDRSLFPQGTSIDTQPVPPGRYGAIEVVLSNRCDSETSLAVTNAQGAFASGAQVRLRFTGEDVLKSGTVKIHFEIQDLVTQLEQVNDDSALVAAAENTSGRWVSSRSAAWNAIASTSSPGPRQDHAAVWTGEEMIVWGGWYNFSTPFVQASGGRYDPDTNTWAPTSTSAAPSARRYHTAVWTGSRMLVWGGEDDNGAPLASGGRYDPSNDTWAALATAGAPTARRGHTAVWTGNRMLVWGGVSSTGAKLNDGGAYDPSTDTWSSMTTTGAPSARMKHTAVWSGTRMIVWGGCSSASVGCPLDSAALNTGGLYDPATDSWTATSLVSPPTSRYSHVAVWTGGEMIVWGGEAYQLGNHYYLGDGARFDPATNTWAGMQNAQAPSVRTEHRGVWTGSKLIIWGGSDNSSFLSTGASYDPSLDSWQPLPITDAPRARRYFTAVWSGSEMIVWGGWNNTVNPVYPEGGAAFLP